MSQFTLPRGNFPPAFGVVGLVRLFGAAAFAAIALVAGAALALRTAQPAGACSGPPGHWSMAWSDVIATGRIVAVDEIAEPPESSYRTFELTVEVDEGFRGATNGDRISVVQRVGKPGQPQMCVGFGDRDTYLGKFVVAGMRGYGPGGGMIAFFMGDDTSASDYAEAVRVAKMAAGVGDGPLLSVPAARCGGLVTVVGARFSPGQQFLLNHPREPGPDGLYPPFTVVRADSSGSFRVQFRVPSDWCPIESFVDAYGWRDDQQIGGWPLAMAPLTATETSAPLPPDVGNSEERGRNSSSLLFAAAGAALIAGLSAAVLITRRRR